MRLAMDIEETQSISTSNECLLAEGSLLKYLKYLGTHKLYYLTQMMKQQMFQRLGALPMIRQRWEGAGKVCLDMFYWSQNH